MATTFAKFASPLIIFSILVVLASVAVDGKHDGFARTLSPKAIGLRKQKQSHFRLYWHDIVGGPNPSAITVASGKTTSTTGFGSIAVIDDPLTEGPDLKSKLVGRAQGFYAAASQQEVGLLMSMNFAFMEGKYNGSTITILGRNTVFSTVREMPVIGGSGLFRFARGYVQARTHKFDPKSGDATVEYNIFVMHY